MSKLLFILYEHASGYALFKVKEFDEVAALLPQVESSITDVSKFESVVNLTAFQAFRSGTNSLDNINAIAAGELHPDLQTFLEKEVPKPKKKISVLLGVGDMKIGQSINETLGFSCQHTGVVPEIFRGIRVHFHHYIKALTESTAGKAQLGLGHSYSRDKVKFNVNRVDNMIIQSISLLDQLDKDINTFSMRIREWYSYHFPELVKIVNDNYMYARVAVLVGDRKKLEPELADEIEAIVMDSAKVKAIYEASNSSMGIDIGAIDLINIQMFARRVISLTEYRATLSNYLRDKMKHVAPNLAALIGEQVGARLISHAGSLTNLAKYPASTVQILGAEKALFRALKTKGNTPKYGLIFHSTFIGRAGAKNKGRISRYLANKCSIASRVDTFSDIPTSVIGEHLKQQVEDRLKFYETGENPAKNIDVMKQAVSEAKDAGDKAVKAQRKKEKKDKKRKLEEEDGDGTQEEINGDVSDQATPKKKKKKKDKQEEEEMDTTQEVEEQSAKKKKKKKSKNGDVSVATENDESMITEDATPKKSKKKKKENGDDTGVSSALDTTTEGGNSEKKKKKKKSKD